MSASCTVRLFLLAIAALACADAGANDSELERLLIELKVAEPPEQFPDHGEYRLFPKLCNERICFKVLAVRFVSHTGPVIQLAVFSEAEHYIGSYKGLKLMPTRAAGPILRFPATTRANAIRFGRSSPPAEIRIDGRTHTFERAR